ncbi:hypothetical protein GGR56DRAFT_572104 [Xylariaceae sp. FL0804]|nr:hypothetical protein GGR56DRAFT_572104 [Xylariaceae sp. FL0804]
MAAKAKNPLNGMHTAGIFSDMSIDGPEIGTLVLIVDRAKNLPNRKTIGKQDPYCAARLGKEAKKTTTDIRGGQTPKWDQELRFNVHDSPDYYQLKLSVFNDDKKTELIGETWIDLRDIVVRGGGQSDQWHSLHCKGKYAGEVRIETTYYDSRPKLEKPKPLSSGSEVDLTGAAAKSSVKRRPLPSDPVTGQAPSPPVADQAHTPPRAQPSLAAAFVPNHSPLQALEYGTPQSDRRVSHSDHHSPAPLRSQYMTPPRVGDRQEEFPAFENDAFHSHSDPRASYPKVPLSYDTPSLSGHHYHQPPENEERPPPPPVHRVRNSTGNFHETHRGSFDSPQHKPMRHDVLRSEAHRNSMHSAPSSPSSAYPGRPTYRPYDSAPSVQNPGHFRDGELSHSSPPRHQSYDTGYESHLRSMQPTVEDVPESWTPPNARPRGESVRMMQIDEREFGSVPSPAPLDLSCRGSVGSEQYRPSALQLRGRHDANGYTSSPSPTSAEYPHALAHVPRQYSNQADYYSNPSRELQTIQQAAGDYDIPSVPPTLVPGVDPILAREVSDRLHEDRKHERRYTQPARMSSPTRGRQHSESVSHYAPNTSSRGHRPTHSMSYDRAPVLYSSGPSTPSGSNHNTNLPRKSPSPSATHTIKRKSVSPAPPALDERRLSGVPFGPDSYDALNPSVASKDLSKSEYTNAAGNIVTSDGREIDPSDHLPMDTWAPEPEPKKTPPVAETRTRPTPAGAQPMPPSGRRQLRIAGRPQSMSTLPTYITPESAPSPPASTGRNRLQKKNRGALPPAPASPASPLGPATARQRNSTPPRAMVRASTFDFENHGPSADGFGSPRAGYGSAPPVPAKVPMMSGGMGPTPPSMGHNQWALMDEMSRIDIGTGRSRRHGGY